MSQVSPRARRLTAVAFIVVAALGAGLACADYVTGPGGDGDGRAVRGLTIALSRSTLVQGDTMRPTLSALDQVGAAFEDMPAGVVIEWSSEDERIATVSEDGLVTAVGVGTTRITARAANIASLPPVSAQITVRYRARLEPVDELVPRGVVGQPLATPVRVLVRDPDAAGVPDVVVRFVVVDPAGDSVVTDVTSDSTGIAELPLTLGTMAGTYVIRVRLRDAADVTATLEAIAIADVPARIEAVSGGGQTGSVGDPLAQPLVARVTDRFGNPVADTDVTFRPEPGSGSASPVTVRTDANGLASAQWTLGTAAGTQRAVAEQGELRSGPFEAIARPGPVARLTTEPAALLFATLGRTFRLATVLTDRFGNAITTQAVSWTSTDPAVATVNAGEVRAVGDGTARVIASAGGVADTTTVSVQQVVATVSASVATLTLDPAQTAQLFATAADSGGSAVSSAILTWRSENESVAQVSASGLLTAVSGGTTRIIASAANGVSDTIVVTVTRPRIPTRIEVLPDSVTVDFNREGRFIQLAAIVYDADGIEMVDAPVTWTSSNDLVARVNERGGVSTGRPGTALVIATSGSVSDTSVITVRRVTSSVQVLPVRVTLAPGQSAQFTATAYDSEGIRIDTATFVWRSSDERVATVTQTGVVTGVESGVATISAEFDGVTGSASSATITTCGPTGIAPFGVAQSLGPPECVLRLNSGTNQGSGGAWSTEKPRIVNGFDITFRFRIHEPGNGGADGFAFIIQSVSGNYIGGGGGGIGYHGLPRSVAIEFDTWHNPPGEAGDPDDNHISVHTAGMGVNNVDESYSIGRINASAMPYRLDDGVVHTVRVRYVPGTMEIYLDGSATPNLTVRVNFSDIDGAGGSILDADGRAWIGFTAATGGAYETHDIVSWEVSTTP